MKSIKSTLSNIGTAILLGVIGVGLVWFFRGQVTDEPQPVAQQPEATPIGREPTATPEQKPTPTTEQKPTEIPTTDAQPTATLHPLTPPDDDSPEPTFTPVIILSKSTPPPTPTFIPSPTPTPINPNEEVIATFDVPVGSLTISPNDQALALVSLVEVAEGTFVNQIWTVDIAPGKVNKLAIEGSRPVWSPNGQQILFRVWRDDEFEIKVVDKSGNNEQSLRRLNRNDLLDYYWTSPQEIKIVSKNGVEQLDLTGKGLNNKPLFLPPGLEDKVIKKVTHGPNEELLLIDPRTRNLLIIQPDGNTVEIADEAQRWVNNFRFSDNGKKVVYVVNEGPNEEIWLNNIVGLLPQQLYRIESGNIRGTKWMPDNQSVLFGWGESGTDQPTTLILIDVESTQQKPVGVHGVDQDFIINHGGDKLFYTRTIQETDAQGKRTYQTTLYQLGM